MPNGITSTEDDTHVCFHSAYCSWLLEKYLKLYSEIPATLTPFQVQISRKQFHVSTSSLILLVVLFVTSVTSTQCHLHQN